MLPEIKFYNMMRFVICNSNRTFQSDDLTEKLSHASLLLINLVIKYPNVRFQLWRNTELHVLSTHSVHVKAVKQLRVYSEI